MVYHNQIGNVYFYLCTEWIFNISSAEVFSVFSLFSMTVPLEVIELNGPPEIIQLK